MRAIAFTCVFAVCARAEVRLPYILTDHMVVQRDMPVHVWGMAAAGEKVAVEFRGNTRSAEADDLGRWSVYLPPGAAGGPFELNIKATNVITLKDVMAGDVWIASGQSNMEWPIRWSADPQAEMKAANHPQIRLVRSMHRVSDYPMNNFFGQAWTACTPQSVEHFSAVAYHFGRNLHDTLGVPIGLIQSAWGGTPLEAWTNLKAISDDPGLMPVFAEWAKTTARHETALLEFSQRLKEWQRAVARAKAEGKQPPDKPEMRRRPGGQWTPAGLFNAMVAPLTQMPIRGVIWYQGEANTAPERAPSYGRLFQTMIRGWREAWDQGDFPFLFVQLANYNAVPDSMWPEVREAQRNALQLANTAMSVTIDIGNPDDIHPRNKREVGYRLSLAARALAYGEKIEYSGPAFRQAAREGTSLRLWFDHAGNGLQSKRGDLRGFEVAGADRRFRAAAARIEGGTVVVTSPGVRSPRYVRYGWKDNPDCNLYNAEGLPASPFRSDSV